MTKQKYKNNFLNISRAIIREVEDEYTGMDRYDIKITYLDGFKNCPISVWNEELADYICHVLNKEPLKEEYPHNLIRGDVDE